MKKTLYTLAFVALVSFASNAQDSKSPKKAAESKETVNPDGTVKQAPAAELSPAQPQAQEAPAEKKQSGTRMAITEKGVPASKKPVEKKAETTSKTEPAKTEKH